MTGTSVVSDSAGNQLSAISYYPYGERWESQGTMPTDKLFTGQRLDGTGLYYYGGRYYDPAIGRFISADTFVPWSTGFEVVANPLTVNAIPQGLGAVLASQGNHPAITAEAPTDPQMLNRYSYVVNAPLRYTDPFGWWTFALGLQGIFGLGGGGAGSISIVVDGHWNIAIVKNAGGGGYGGASASGGLQIQYTSAESVDELQGLSSVSGFSTEVPNVAVGRAGVSLGGEFVLGLGDSTYTGVNINIGLGGGVGPFEMHSMIENSWVDEIDLLDNLSSHADDLAYAISYDDYSSDHYDYGNFYDDPYYYDFYYYYGYY